MGTIAHVAPDAVEELAKGSTRVGACATTGVADAQPDTIASAKSNGPTTTLDGERTIEDLGDDDANCLTN